MRHHEEKRYYTEGKDETDKKDETKQDGTSQVETGRGEVRRDFDRVLRHASDRRDEDDPNQEERMRMRAVHTTQKNRTRGVPCLKGGEGVRQPTQ